MLTFKNVSFPVLLWNSYDTNNLNKRMTITFVYSILFFIIFVLISVGTTRFYFLYYYYY